LGRGVSRGWFNLIGVGYTFTLGLLFSVPIFLFWRHTAHRNCDHHEPRALGGIVEWKFNAAVVA
jgi:hypothetical protein